MKFEELSILKYGALVDFKPISFEPNLNVLLGDNGSGKSSIVKSLYNLLFGIPTKKEHHFYYDYDGPTAVAAKELGAGAVILNIDNNGDKLSISRSKWDKNINEQIKDIYPQLDDVEKMQRLFSNFFFTSTKMISDIKESISLDKNIRNDLIKLISVASGSMSQNVEEAIMSYAEYATTLTDKTEKVRKNPTKIGELQNNLKDVNEKLKELEKTERENKVNLSKNDEDDIAELRKDIVGLNAKISKLESTKNELQIQQKYIENIGELLDSLNSLQNKNIKINSYKTHKLIKIQSDYKNLNESISEAEVEGNNLKDLNIQLKECEARIGGVKKTTLKALEIDAYLNAFDEYENANNKVILQIYEVENLETTLTEIEEELNLNKTSVAYYKKTKLKDSDKNKILTISEKINEFDLQPLVDEIAELKDDIINKEQEIKDFIESCGFSPQTITKLKKEKITAKDKALLKKLNQEILDIKQNADETKIKLKRLNEDKADTQLIDYSGDDIFSITESIQNILEENQKKFKTVHKSNKDIKKLEELLNSIIENETLIISKVSLIHDDYENLVENLTARLQVQSIDEEIKLLKLKEKAHTSDVKAILNKNETILKKYKLSEATLKDSDFSYYLDELDDLIDLEEELNTLNDSKSKLENELRKKKESFSEIKKASDELIQKFKVSKSFIESEDLDTQLDLLIDLYQYTLNLKGQNLELNSLTTDLNSKKTKLKKMLEPFSKEMDIENLEKTSLEIYIEDFNNSISKFEEDFEIKRLLVEEIKKAKKSITDAEKMNKNILNTYDAESLIEIESVILVLEQLETLLDDNKLNFFTKSEKDEFAKKILSSELNIDTLFVNSGEIDNELEETISKREDKKLRLSSLESALFTEPDYKKEDLLSEKYKILREWQEARKQYLSTVLALYLVDEQLKNTANITLDLKKRINSIISKINPNLSGVEFNEEDDILSVKYQVSKENTRDKEIHLHSDGEQAAIALAVRMAVQLETFKNSDFRFPLFYDDISDHLDRNSQAGFIEVLEDIATETQVVVLTHDEVFAEALSKSSQDVNLIDLNNR